MVNIFQQPEDKIRKKEKPKVVQPLINGDRIRNNPTLIRVLPTPVKNGTKLDGVRKKVFLDRYALKDKKGRPLEKYPEQMWRRVAKAIAQIEKEEDRAEWEEKFYKSMENFKFVPGGRILSGAGTGYYVTYYNCYVLPSPKDSRHGILDNLKEMVEIMSRGGGVGINLSSLRPRGARVKKVNGFSSGPMNWAELYSVATHDIIQQGGSRRGALMLMLWDWHPDIEEFITVKTDLTRIVGANLSVCVSDRFMKAVEENQDWQLIFPDLDDPDYDEVWDGDIERWVEMGKKVKVYKVVPARRLWDMICEAAWKSAEPGCVFMERYNKMHNNWYFNKINCVNPCGEEGLPPYGVCNLGSLNLAQFVDENGRMDYELLAEHVKVAVRFLDNVIDGDIYILPGSVKTQLEGERRIGLGTMGLGDALIKMKVRYGSDESLAIIEKIYKTIRDVAFETSSDLAAEKGPFPKFDAEKYLQGGFAKTLPEYIREKIRKQGIRNSVLLMQAPTGSTSLMCGVTSGIEPVYEFTFIRRDRIGVHKIYHPLYKAWKDAHPDEPVPDYFVSANDLTPEDHVRVQAMIQKYVDASISKTVNAPKTHTVEDVKKLYTLAYKLGCKGITYMREGSREGVLQRAEEKETGQEKTAESVSQAGVLAERPSRVVGATYRVPTPQGNAFITINNDEKGNPIEVFINIGKAGSDLTAMATALGRVISTTLRINATADAKARAEKISEQLSGIGGRRSVGFGLEKVYSLPDAVARTIKMHLAEMENEGGNNKNQDTEKGNTTSNGSSSQKLQAEAVMVAHNPDPTLASAGLQSGFNNDLGDGSLTHTPVPIPMDLCPVCGEIALVHEEGCAKCYACGYSEC